MKEVDLIDAEMGAIHVCFCPRVEDVSLSGMDIKAPSSWRCASLKRLPMEGLLANNLRIDADALESLWINNCEFGKLHLVGRPNLGHLTIEDNGLVDLGLGEEKKGLQIMDINNSTIRKGALFRFISPSKGFEKLKVWPVTTMEDTQHSFLKMEKLALTFPNLKSLSLNFNVDGAYINVDGTWEMGNLTELELGFAAFPFAEKLEVILSKCPGLESAIIHFYDMKSELTVNGSNVFVDTTKALMAIALRYVRVKFSFKLHRYGLNGESIRQL